MTRSKMTDAAFFQELTKQVLDVREYAVLKALWDQGGGRGEIMKLGHVSPEVIGKRVGKGIEQRVRAFLQERLAQSRRLRKRRAA